MPVKSSGRETSALSPLDAAHLAIEVLLEKKCQDILLLDISRCSDLADYMMIATARSGRQAYAAVNELAMRLKKAGMQRISLAGAEPGTWVVLDYGDIFVHVMQREQREYYDLEALWADAVVAKRIAGEATPAAEVV